MRQSGGKNPMEFGKSKARMISPDKLNVRFSDIAGADEAKEDISEIVEFFEEKPYGLQKEITYLLIAILVRNGNIAIINKNGKSYSSSEVCNKIIAQRLLHRSGILIRSLVLSFHTSIQSCIKFFLCASFTNNPRRFGLTTLLTFIAIT